MNFPYWMWLLGLAVIFSCAERLWPRRIHQRFWRNAIGLDLVYVILNGHFLGLILGWFSMPLSKGFTAFLNSHHLKLSFQIAKTWPILVQFFVALILIDFIQWCIHNLMHRIPLFWEFHKVHHSIMELDWLGSLRFHWVEVAIYKILQYPVLAFCGFNYQALFAIAIVSTFIGNYNHSNLRFNLGYLKYLFNSPEMHEWHHVHTKAGPTDKNFAINLSIWDWVFGTAYLPQLAGSSPTFLGFHDVEFFPRNLVQQELWPFSSWKKNQGMIWVLFQFLLFSVYAVLPSFIHWPLPMLSGGIGWVMLLYCFAMSIPALYKLGKNLTPLPEPGANAVLVESGPFRWVRNPIYSSLSIGAIGYAFLSHEGLRLLLGALIFVFLDRKSSAEEVGLASRYPKYMEYRKRVKKMIPFLY